MSSSYQIDSNVLLTTVRVQAALRLVPRILGSQTEWAFWMRDGLERELVSDPLCFLPQSLKNTSGNVVAPTFQTHHERSTP